MIKERKHILIKGMVVGFGLLAFAIAIVTRLILLQTNTPQDLKDFALHTNIREKKIEAQRGNLYASNGELLAISVTKYDIYLDVLTVKEKLFQEELYALSDSLSKMFGKKPTYYQRSLTTARKSKNQYWSLAKGLGYFDLERLKNFPILEKGQIRGGLIVERRIKRVFPSNQIGRRTLGYDSEKGQAGLEGAYGVYLRGVDGVQEEQRITGQSWKPIHVWEEPKDGSDVYTTIDVNMQEMSYQALEEQLIEFEADHGSVVVMEVKTGEVKAIVNLARKAEGVYEDNRNFAVYEANEPGSCIKLVSVMAAIEDGYANKDTYIDLSEGRYTISGRTIRDTHKLDKFTLKDVFEQSSNVGVAKLIQENYKNNPEKFVEKWQDWRLDEKLDIAIPGEGKPYIPNPEDSLWNGITLPWMAYGYSTKLTPLQILTFYNGVANDGQMLKPIFIKKIVSEKKEKKEFLPEIRVKEMAKPETIRQVKEMMEGVINNGTGRGLKLENYPLAGKTSTVQAEYWKKGPMQYRSSFVGYFPADNPIYSCIVIIHKPNRAKGIYGGIVAGPVFRTIAEKIFYQTPIKYSRANNVVVNQQKQKTLPVLEETKILPNLVGYNGYEAIAKMENAGLRVAFKGVGRVKAQSIPPGSAIHQGQLILLRLEE